MHQLLSNILYSCVDERQRGHEQFVAEHALGYMIAGESHIHTNSGTRVYAPGSIGLVRRNQLLKSVKVPPPDGEFRSINILLTQDLLRQYSADTGVAASGAYTGEPLLLLHDNPFFKGYFNSLLPYFDAPQYLTPAIAELKTREAIELLLRYDPALRNWLFDFSKPHKIDLEAFMQQNYRYNIPVSRFARLTGRSLAGFKRDFEKIFHTSPGQWLQQRRLSEAHYQIREQGRRPSDVYLDVGFENLSHFSFVFKKAYGVSPSAV
ncbi:MAG: AraC family transcriptional regulator [Chitinophagaceae bacterium]